MPTMGALHPGHISLLDTAKNDCPIVVCSIFVNPTQFNDAKDFANYPVTLESDIDMLEEAGCDVLFLPAVSEIYPNGLVAGETYDLGYLETVLEGKYRPGHFQGVCRVVQRLLEIVRPAHLYLGRKDFQQCMVIKKLIGLLDLEQQVTLHICPTLRENDGLAMSSRNRRLSPEARQQATAIYQSLQLMKSVIQTGPLDPVKQKARALLEQSGFRIDYVEIADAADLSLLNEWDGSTAIVALIAAFLADVRLIDNMQLR